MSIIIDRDTLIKNLTIASGFTSSRINTAQALQGVYVSVLASEMHFYATDLNTHCHIVEKIDEKTEFNAMLDQKKIIEFLNLLSSGPVEMNLQKNSVSISQDKAKGVFQITQIEDFPLPPETKKEFEKVSVDFLVSNLPFILFTASTDEARPVLTGVNFVSTDEDIVMVSTDGFRLSVIKDNNKAMFPSMIVPAGFLKELLKLINQEDRIEFSFLEKEKTICFKLRNIEIFSRIIDGQFPPYEKVIPDSRRAVAKINRQDLLRNTKLISIFARDYSNVILYSFSKEGLLISPKKEANSENSTVQEMEFEGEAMKVAFNHKYLVDFLNATKSKEVVIELLRPDAPVVFKSEDNKSFMHIIMPVRVQE